MSVLKAAGSLLACLVIATLFSSTAAAQFVEPDVDVLRLLSGEQDGDYFGWILANVDDIDGDGVDEFLVPAIAHDGFAGRVRLFSGADGAVLHEVLGAPGSALGYAVGAGGDVNGDSVPDYVLGGGQVLVYSGSDHQLLFDLTAVTDFADSVRGVGDLNGDGYGDVLVGSQATSDVLTNAGRVFAFSGADGSLLWTRDGASEGDALGSAVGALGDVNFDGVPDVVVGSSGAGPSDGGEALVLDGVDGSLIRTLRPADEDSASDFGQFFASGAGDFDGDGVQDIFVGDFGEGTGPRAGSGAVHIFSGRSGRRIHLLRGLKAGEGLGLGRGIPDVNGDGRPDIIVGAYTNSEGAPNGGAAYLFSGRSGALLRTLTATLDSDNFGGDAVSIGDANGDGLPDFVVAAPGQSFLGIDHGRAYVIGGSVLPCPADLNGNGWVLIRDIRLLRQAFGDTGGPADLNGDGIVDIRDLWVLVRDLGRCPAGFPG